MVAFEAIENAIKLIDAKKESLKEAYDALQAHASLLSPAFSLSWSDIDAHFTERRNSLSHRFRQLESQESAQSVPSSSNPPVPSTTSQSGSSGLHRSNSFPSVALPPDPFCFSKDERVEATQAPADGSAGRQELKELCKSMDGKGLRNYVNKHSKEREAIRNELLDAMRCASDTAALVVDAVESFYAESSRAKGGGDSQSYAERRVLILLLEQLMVIKPNLDLDVRNRAKKLALEWRANASFGDNRALDALCFLHFVAGYELGPEFDMNDLVNLCFVVSRYKQAMSLCSAIGLGDRVADLIQKLLDNGRQILAVKFIFNFEMSDRFPPVPILKQYLRESETAAKKVCEEGKNSLKALNEASDKEVSALKAILKVIEEYKLESEYPRELLEKRVAEIEKRKAERKRPTSSAAKPQKQAKNQQKKQHQCLHKHPRMVQSTVPGASLSLPLLQQTQQQPTGLLSDHSAIYLNSYGRHYGPVNSTYGGGSSARLHGLAGATLGYSGLASPAAHSGVANPTSYSGGMDLSGIYSGYPSDYQGASGFGDLQTAYNGYSLPPQYHQAYHPQ